MDDIEAHQEYELNHRLQNSDNWNVSTFFLENVSTVENGSSIYKLEKLSPETCYELKMCLAQNNVKSEYTKNTIQQTKKTGNNTYLITFPAILLFFHDNYFISLARVSLSLSRTRT